MRNRNGQCQGNQPGPLSLDMLIRPGAVLILALLLTACRTPPQIVQNHVDAGVAGTKLMRIGLRNIEGRRLSDREKTRLHHLSLIKDTGSKQGGKVSTAYVEKALAEYVKDLDEIEIKMQIERGQVLKNFAQFAGWRGNVYDHLTSIPGLRPQDLKAFNDALERKIDADSK